MTGNNTRYRSGLSRPPSRWAHAARAQPQPSDQTSEKTTRHDCRAIQPQREERQRAGARGPDRDAEEQAAAAASAGEARRYTDDRDALPDEDAEPDPHVRQPEGFVELVVLPSVEPHTIHSQTFRP